MTVKELRRRLQRAIDNLQGEEDDAEVRIVSNTYFLGDCRMFLGISGYDGGYINLDDPVENEEEDW